ncbi:bifunctional glutamate N-acetyltransferase/amino-acid acetyltransferase ArgJ [Amylibacter sp. SFDW26]|uniref:bifunctional glutamate N-acetyltransferase/amino-acid acetyltransferase ArgJ n=1 Tax=Amylibacter sp. SFDW26 TaxID=2652722 RepID=UPI001262712D|nr:bifunctional glutamate N-acetyltransferase/amino-acid acetyltransferase ArgJ [Amylibacter sp. SFDW26]KAB7614599.1 bifunctional glutamate N-acetyltransferase/amino-acid acetyltransferase ArgJ [Amylibacter sp. SFDW26]
MSAYKAQIERLEQKIADLEAQLKVQETANIAPKVSPLAPKAGFPELPEIAGVRYAAGQAGVKYQGRDDVMLVEAVAGSSVAGVFTRSATRSAPVLDCQAKLANSLPADKPIAILVNSGNSNAFTGARGDGSVQAICQTVADQMNTVTDCVFTASTGVIGEPLPHDRIVAQVADLKSKLSSGAGESAARAIMTTDTFPKGVSAEITLDGKPIHIAGFAKGSGMIAPDMATMLVYIFTDAAVEQTVLQSMVSEINESSFNSITVDSDTSTSDSLMLVATGQSGASMITDAGSGNGKAFAAALKQVMLELSHLVVKDGEGATKFVTVKVSNAVSDASARTIALAIANSPLVKTAIAGEDPNWGRVVMAIGKSGEPADRDKVAISFGDIVVAENGWVSDSYTEGAGAAYMKNEEITISTDVGMGTGSATVWTCDLTHQYITINADYRS